MKEWKFLEGGKVRKGGKGEVKDKEEEEKIEENAFATPAPVPWTPDTCNR